MQNDNFVDLPIEFTKLLNLRRQKPSISLVDGKYFVSGLS